MSRVLVVDNEITVRDAVSKMLMILGFEVIQAGDGVEALHRYKESPGNISLVIMDSHLPGMGGLEAANRINHFDPFAKVIFSSGWEDQHTVRAFQNAFLPKPYTMAELKDAVQRVLADKLHKYQPAKLVSHPE